MSSNPNAPTAAQRHPRVLACVLCQHRKIKCDRNTPCSNCLKVTSSALPQWHIFSDFQGQCDLHSKHPGACAQTTASKPRSPGAPCSLRVTS